MQARAVRPGRARATRATTLSRANRWAVWRIWPAQQAMREVRAAGIRAARPADTGAAAELQEAAEAPGMAAPAPEQAEAPRAPLRLNARALRSASPACARHATPLRFPREVRCISWIPPTAMIRTGRAAQSQAAKRRTPALSRRSHARCKSSAVRLRPQAR